LRTDLVVGPLGAWFGGRRFPCAVGRGGVGDKRAEGDGITPVGRHRIEAVLWRADRLARPVAMRIGPSWVRSIGPRDGWSDDPADPDYNRPVRRPHRYRSEALRRADPLYDLVAVLDWNRHPVAEGRGSAIFVHVWKAPRRPTEGCIALRRSDLRWILRRWTPQSRVVVRSEGHSAPLPSARSRRASRTS
jgi:L,D-peptidoglycan transpeptidase YkuD (ErfK/YbiS/YcfS/YnhG family)